jgi:hypothetical protein
MHPLLSITIEAVTREKIEKTKPRGKVNWPTGKKAM